MYFYAGEGATVSVDFEVNGELVVPDSSSVFYTIRNNAGVAIAGHDNVAVVTDATTTRISIAIDASVNAKTLTVEKRTVSVIFTYQGSAYRVDTHYRLTDWINLATTPKHVRSLIGVSPFELPDQDVDLFQAYLNVKAELASGDLDVSLVAGDRTSYFANLAVTYKAALLVLPSLQLRVRQSEQSDTLKYARLAQIDFTSLRADLTKSYEEAINVLEGVVEATTPTLFTVSTPTDVITG